MNRYNTAQADIVDQDNRNMATGASGVLPMSQEIDALWTSIDTGSIGIQSLAPDVDSLAQGGGAFTVDTASMSGLVFAWKASRFHNGLASVIVSAGNLALAASNTNYVELDRSGVVYSNTSAFTSGRYPLYTVATGTATIITISNAKPLIVLLGPASVTGQILSALAAQKHIEKDLASVSATTSFNIIAPCAGTVIAAVIASAATAAANDTNYWTVGIINKRTTNPVLDTGADNTTKLTGGSAITAYTARSLPLNSTSGYTTVQANDVLEVTVTMTAAPTTLTEFSLRLDFGFQG